MRDVRCPALRRLAALGLTATTIAAGCQSTGFRLPTIGGKTPPPTATAAPAPPAAPDADPGVVQTEFRREVPPDDRVMVHLDLGRSQEAQGNVEAAIYEYARAVEAADQPGRAARQPAATVKALAHRRMAGALDRIGRFAQAEAHYRQALELAPKDPRVWNDAGYSAYLQKRWGDAEMRLRTAARLDPADLRVQTNLGLCLAAAGRTDEALEALTHAAGPAIAHANLGYLLAATGRAREAREHYRLALQIQPALEPARLALARLDEARSDAPAAALAGVPSSDASIARTATMRPSAARTGLSPSHDNRPISAAPTTGPSAARAPLASPRSPSSPAPASR